MAACIDATGITQYSRTERIKAKSPDPCSGYHPVDRGDALGEGGFAVPDPAGSPVPNTQKIDVKGIK